MGCGVGIENNEGDVGGVTDLVVEGGGGRRGGSWVSKGETGSRKGLGGGREGGGTSLGEEDGKSLLGVKDC
jgi:hypothetical protein